MLKSKESESAFAIAPDCSLSSDSQFADLLFGSMSGFTGKLVEYPFDTIKVHLQTQNKLPGWQGTRDCIDLIYRSQGFRGFFRGLSGPLVGSMVENSVLFIAYNRIQQQIRSLNGLNDTAPLSISQLCLSGALSGAVVSYVLTPVELVKCQLQVKEMRGISGPSGPFSLLWHTFRTQGIAGMYRGHWGTLMREIAGGAAWFGVYETVVKNMVERSPHAQSKRDLSPWQLMGAGALAGMSYNAALFPADVVKSRQQTSLNPSVTFMNVARKLWRTDGFRGFYRGFGITIARSAPSSGVIFLTYELLSRNLTV